LGGSIACGSLLLAGHFTDEEVKGVTQLPADSLNWVAGRGQLKKPNSPFGRIREKSFTKRRYDAENSVILPGNLANIALRKKEAGSIGEARLPVRQRPRKTETRVASRSGCRSNLEPNLTHEFW
jgi:hypothetical protein